MFEMCLGAAGDHRDERGHDAAEATTGGHRRGGQAGTGQGGELLWSETFFSF